MIGYLSNAILQKFLCPQHLKVSIQTNEQAARKCFLYINGKLQPLGMFACTPVKLNLTTPYDYSHIKSLTFFHEKEQLENIAAQVISSNRKAVFFIQSTERALELYRKFENKIVFMFQRQS